MGVYRLPNAMGEGRAMSGEAIVVGILVVWGLAALALLLIVAWNEPRRCPHCALRIDRRRR